MVKETLVGLDLNGGQRILAALDEAKFPAPVALWIRRAADEEWALLIASPLYDKLPPGKANLKMVETLWPVQLNWVHAPIQLVSTRQPLIRALRRIFGKTASVDGMRLGGQMIGDTWIDDAYVYRIR